MVTKCPNSLLPWGCFVISIAACVSCINSIVGDFVFDDSQAIVNNKDVLPSTPIRQIFENDFWGTRLTLNSSHKSYRPLTVLTFRLNYILSDGLEPSAFHAVNIVLHMIVSTLTWPIFMKFLNREDKFYGFIASLLFAVHPVHTEAVCGIVGRADLLCAVFFFLSFLCYSKAAVPYINTTSIIFLLVSILLAAISMFCKEQGITVIGICCVYDLIIVNKLDPVQLCKILKYKLLAKRKNIHWPIELTRKSFIIRIMVLMCSCIVLLWFRYYLMNYQGPEFQPVDNPASFHPDFIVKLLTYNYIFALNAWLLLCPEWLCFDWSMGCVPLLSPTDKRVLVVLIFWLILSCLFFKTLNEKNNETRRLLTMCLSLIIVPFLPASNLLFKVGFVIAERILYISSAGFCLLIVFGFQKLLQKHQRYNNDIFFVLGLVVLIFVVKSNERSKEWRNESSLFNSALKVCPLNAKVHYNVAKSAADTGYEDKAIAGYREAIRLYPEYDQAMNNLANLLKNRGEYNEAEALLRRALKLRHDFPPAWMNLGIVLSQKKRYPEAEKCYHNALKYRKHYGDCYYNLGNLYLDQKRHTEAEKAWLNAVKIKPKLVIAWNNLILLNDNNGNYSRAVELASKALSVLPDEPSIHFNMANALGKLGRLEESEKHFMKALKIDQNNGLYNVNLGVLYHRWKKYDKAEIFYKRALKIDSSLKSAVENYALLKKQVAEKDKDTHTDSEINLTIT